ncbi:amidohydrolase family protein [Clostridium akagii]|uniref:amidohydrolase family protein n=1 Tax=Clostridium akagii TaxID=91623 RepID=UPI00047DB8BF|nr:amidohydrolase family protein [Clostridium akagii]
MKIVGIEEHFLTNSVRNAWSVGEQDSSQGLNMGEVENRLDDLSDGRIKLMDESGVDIQVLSLTSPGLHNLGSVKSVDLARQTNDLVSATVSLRPDRFEGFATLPTAAPREATLELERSIRHLRLKGAMLCGRTQEKNLDHSDFLPIFEAAESLHVPLFIHPQIPQRAVQDAYYSGFGSQVDLAFATFGLGWHYESGIQFLRLVLAGVFDRFPNLQVILGHWGEVILFYTERLKNLDRVAKLQRPIVDYMRHNLYVTSSGMFSQSYLQRSIEIVGVDRILFSTDYPYQYRPGGGPGHFLDEAALSPDEKDKIAHINWERLSRPNEHQ